MFRLDQRTKEAIEVIKACDDTLPRMRELGFRPPNHSDYSPGSRVWIGRHFVLKTNNAGLKDKPKRAVPTKLMGFRDWVIQPRCKPMLRRDFEALLASKQWGFGPYVNERDINYKNAGYYNGNPVLIDW